MNITTKYTPTDMVWMMVNNKPYEVVITQVVTTTISTGNGTKVITLTKYSVFKMDPKIGIDGVLESSLFSTKEELIKSLY